MGYYKTFMKSSAFLYFLIGILCLLLACLAKDYDFDLFARLIVGDHFYQTGWISYEDFLSYTPTHIWHDHEWGSSIVFYTFLKLFGPFGLILIHSIAMFFTVFFVTKTQQLQKHAYPVSLLFITIFTLFFAHLNPSIVRCHMFSFMFFSMTLYMLEKTRLTNSNILWLFPFITIIWNNLHGGVVSGIGMIFIYMIGAILTKKTWRKYFYVLILSGGLLTINPYGIDYITFLLSANTMARTYITEWWPVFAQRHILYYFPTFCIIAFAILLTCTKLYKKENFNLTKIMALLVTAYLGTIHVKLLSITLIVIASLYYNDIIRLVNKSVIKNMQKAITIGILISMFYIPFTDFNTPRFKNKKFPYKEVEFLRINNIDGNILTSFGFGSYVSYKLDPKNKIFMDGRYEEVYSDREFNALMDYELINDNWDDILYNYPTQILLPEKINPIYSHLQKQPDWEEVYTGDAAGVFLRKNRNTNKGPFVLPSDDTKHYQSILFEKFGKFGVIDS
ncbi:hypothetical protein IJD34_07740 [bacterium]|nr:hypothetical protein [bacterium]